MMFIALSLAACSGGSTSNVEGSNVSANHHEFSLSLVAIDMVDTDMHKSILVEGLPLAGNRVTLVSDD